MIYGKKLNKKYLKFALTIACLLLLLVGSMVFLIMAKKSTQNTAQGRHLSTTATPPVLTGTPSLTPQPLFYDAFLNNKKGWYTANVAGYTRTIEAGTLTLSDTNHTVLTESLPTNDTFDNVTVITTFVLEKADEHDSVGLYVRGDSNLDHDYRFEVFGNNTYAISKESLDTTNTLQVVSLVGPTHNSHLHPLGQENTLSVTTKGPTMVLTMNGQVMTSLHDNDYKRGQIALFVTNGATSDGVTASFKNITVYPVSDTVPN